MRRSPVGSGYWQEEPAAPSRPRPVRVKLPDLDAMGADTLQRDLDGAGRVTERWAAKQGYRVLRVSSPGVLTRLSGDDLAVVSTTPPRRGASLGHLAGGMADPGFLLTNPSGARAALKVKAGAWWVDQLARFVDVADAMRAAGYPTPAVTAHGALGGERAYLLSESVGGRQPERLSRDGLDHGDFTTRNLLFDDGGERLSP